MAYSFCCGLAILRKLVMLFLIVVIFLGTTLGATAEPVGNRPPWDGAQAKARSNAFPAQDVPAPAVPLGNGARGVPLANRASAANQILGSNFSNYRKPNGQRAYADMAAAGVAHDRVTFDMNSLQPSRNHWVWEHYDLLVNDGRNAGIETTGTFISSADWAADKGVARIAFFMPANLYLPWNHADNYWGQFVHKTVLHFKDRMHAWEIWNEPNLGDYWQGTPEQFAQMMKVSYLAIKAADPKAIVVTAGLYREAQPGFAERMFRSMAADPAARQNNNFADAVAYHLYDGGSCTQHDELSVFMQQARSTIGNKPLWITESGIRVWDSAQAGFALPSEAAAFLVQNYTYALQSGAARYYVFRAIDPMKNDPQPWGMLDANGAPRRSYTALQTVARWLPTRHELAFPAWVEDGRVHRTTFYNTNVGRVSVVWNISRNAINYTMSPFARRVRVVYPDGRSEIKTPGDGPLTLRLEAAVNFRWLAADGRCQVGGEPLIVIEEDTLGPNSSLEKLPAEVKTPEVVLKFSAVDPGDPESSTGVWAFDVEYRVGTSAWQRLTSYVDGSRPVTFKINPNQPVAFRVRARDAAGNTGPWSEPTATQFVP